MNDFVQDLFNKHLRDIIETDLVAIPDDEEEMNWRIFFAHSQDMLGFAADIFTGGPNERTNPFYPTFVGLRPRWERSGGDSRSLIADLAKLWEDENIRGKLIKPTGGGVQPTLDLLHESGVKGAQVFAQTVSDLRGRNIAFNTNAMIRAYIENSHLLRTKHDGSFRAYLQSIVPGQAMPPTDVLAAEKQWRKAIANDFYHVGPAIACYMICDWLLWFWRDGRIDWFESYKPDSVHVKAVETGLLPQAARQDFTAYCKSLPIPEGLGKVSGKPCPPRVLNECIWLEFNANAAVKAKLEAV